MKISTNLICQGAAAVIVFANVHGSLIPAKYQWALGIAVALAQAVVGIRAHYSNIDGTPQTMAYRPADAPVGK